MKILFLSQRFVLPMDTGGKIRTGKILEQLAKNHDLTLISNVDLRSDEPYFDEINKLCTRFISVTWRDVSRRSPLFYLRLVIQLFSRYPVSVLNTYSRKLRRVFEKVMESESYDIVICDFVQCALFFKNTKGTPTVLFQHNVEAMIAARHVEQSRNLVSRGFWALQERRMRRFEREYCSKFDRVIAVSENDKQAFESLYRLSNVDTIPTGVDIAYYRPSGSPSPRNATMAFCGSMDWLPNEDGVGFFIHEVLPIIRRKMPEARLTVVGRRPSRALQKMAAAQGGIDLTGWVEDTRPYIAESAVFIVPLRIGGGTRMKIFEAMAMGKVVISTTIGAEGLPVISGENAVIADEPGQFAEAVVEFLQDPFRRERVGAEARKSVAARFGWDRVAESFTSICESSIEQCGKRAAD